MKYYLHDTSSFDDEKVTQLYLNFGYEGLGLFYTLLEKLAKQEKPILTEVLKAQLKVGKRLEKCWLFMEQIGIISSKNGETFNENILNFSEKYQIKKEKTRKKIAEWRDKQTDIKNVTSYETICNPRKVKESKVKESKVNKILMPFGSEIFIATWDKWKKYKDEEHRFKFKGTTSEQSALNQLVNLSNNNETISIKIIEQSISNGWKGFFQIKSVQQSEPHRPKLPYL